MKEELKKELEHRGTAEISNGVVNQVTQAINESPTETTLLIFGQLKTLKIKPIDECCKVCDFIAKREKGIKYCRDFQKKDAEARGFHQMICPKQFID